MTLDLSRVRDLLTGLYGRSQAEALLPRIAERIDRFRPRLSAPPSHGPWTERDAFLLAYPDQVRSPGVPPLRTLLDLSRRHTRDAFTGIHVLPFFPSSSDDGFAVMDYRAVDPAYGTWDDIVGIGDSFRLMVDLVLNHASAQGSWFAAFRQDRAPEREYFLAPDVGADWSKVVRPRTSPLFTTFPTENGDRTLWTTFGPDQVDLDYRSPELLLEVIDVLLGYVERRAQVIRLDAVAFIWKEAGTDCVHRPQVHRLVRLLRAVLDAAAPWVRLVTETNVPHQQNISYFGDGDEADLVYQFPLPPLIAHTLLSGDSTRLSQWAAALAPPPGRATFFNFLASHDGVGLYPVYDLLDQDELAALERETIDRGGVVSRRTAAGGERPYELNINLLDLLSGRSQSIPRFRVAHAMLLALAGVPALYFHSLFGSHGDPDGAARSGIPRRINRQRLDASSLEAVLQDPKSERRRILDDLLQLLEARRSTPHFSPYAGQEILELGPAIFAVRRGGVLCLHEVTGVEGSVELPVAFRRSTDLLTGRAPPEGHLRLRPYQVSWLSLEP